MNDTKFFLVISLLVLSMVTLPYIFAARLDGGSHVFNGFLLNPIDGNSYLAKMYQGWEGEWRFRLPFTSDPGKGAFLFLFYLGLGHLSRVLNLPLIAVFHSTRLLASFLLLYSLWEFYGGILKTRQFRKLAFALASLGSGLGWLLVPFGSFTADFWVAETYPFLSSYANPHFPLGLALLLCLVNPRKLQVQGWHKILTSALVAFALSIINPFGIVIALMVLIGIWLWAFLLKAKPNQILTVILTVTIFGFPMVIYDYWVALSDPVFANWNAQNITPSPDLWDLVISLSPALIFGIWGVITWKRSKSREEIPMSLLVFWAVLGLISIYLPLDLQRRFMMGLYVPLAGLAAYGIEALSNLKPGWSLVLNAGVLLFSIPTNLLILLAANGGIHSRNPQIFLTTSEIRTLMWISNNSDPDDLILASPDMGLFIPSYSGRRVLYGHPFETVLAEQEKAIVLDYFQGRYETNQVESFIQNRGIDYVLYGPREKDLGNAAILPEWEIVFENDDVIIYRATP